MHTYDLETLGWTSALSQAFAPHAAEGLVPARVAAQHRGRFVLFTADGDLSAEATGRLHQQGDRTLFPVTGDWVAVRPSSGVSLIEAVLPRRSAFTRSTGDATRTDGHSEVQVLAANLDLLLVVTAADRDLNLRRLERYLAAAWQSGAKPAIVLTKLDLAEDPEGLVRQLQEVAPGAEVLAVSNRTGDGVEEIRRRIPAGTTAALLGSSGVGKSSLVNRLLGEERQAVSEVSALGRGRHTTTARELLLLPEGGLVLDTPGMRLFTPGDDAGLEAAFADVELLAAECRFKDCGHGVEPGCAVQAAVRSGVLERSRLEGYAKLHGELGHAADKATQAPHQNRWKSTAKARGRDKRPGPD